MLKEDDLTGYRSGNLVLDALSSADRATMEADLTVIVLESHTYTHSVGDLVTYVDFPIDAVLSVVATLENGESVEVGTAGCESFVETDAALDASRSQRTSFCQVRGRVARMPIERFDFWMENSSSFRRVIQRNVRATLFSAQQFAACNAKHSILHRCARWMAMTEDRVGRADFTLTHEFLSIMLGVRRASVSEAADEMLKAGAITYRCGAVSVLDRALLHGLTCECYEACKQAFAASRN